MVQNMHKRLQCRAFVQIYLAAFLTNKKILVPSASVESARYESPNLCGDDLLLSAPNSVHFHYTIDFPDEPETCEKAHCSS